MKKYTIKTSNHFDKWFSRLPVFDKARLHKRFERIERGNLGDYKWFGDIGEFRFFFGKGYRVYYTVRNNEILFLLCGGDKKSQDSDFKKARTILQQIGE